MPFAQDSHTSTINPSLHSKPAPSSCLNIPQWIHIPESLGCFRRWWRIIASIKVGFRSLSPSTLVMNGFFFLSHGVHRKGVDFSCIECFEHFLLLESSAYDWNGRECAYYDSIETWMLNRQYVRIPFPHPSLYSGMIYTRMEDEMKWKGGCM